MGDVSSAGVALILVFVFVLLAVAVELTYVLWYRRRFKQASPFGAGDSESAVDPFGTPDSKEVLLYNVLSHGHGHLSRSERAPPLADNFYSLPPAMGYAWPGSGSPSPWPSPLTWSTGVSHVAENSPGTEKKAFSPWPSPPARYGGVPRFANYSPEQEKNGSSPSAPEKKGGSPEKDFEGEEKRETLKTVGEEEEEGETSFEFVQLGTADPPTPFYTPSASPSREKQFTSDIAYYSESDEEVNSLKRAAKLLRRVDISQ